MRFLRRLGVTEEESAAVSWSWLFFFCVLSSYYVLRPIRDDMAVASGVSSLPWLFAGSLAGMLALNPLFAWITGRFRREWSISLSYAFFALNLVGFFVLFQTASASQHVWAGRVFFIWTSVFNIFIVAIFRTVMVDVFSSDQGQRLFGLIGAAGTIGSITGSALTSWLVAPLGAANMLLVSAGLLQVAAFSARRLFRLARDARKGTDAVAAPERAGLGGSVWEGARRALTDKRFVNITLQMVLFTVLTTFLYFQQATLVDSAIADRTTRTQFFANIDLIVNVLALVTQTFATGWFIRVFGITAALAFLPAVGVAGFSLLAFAPTVTTLMLVQVVRRAGNFAVNQPAREVLFTVVPPLDRYKTKAFIDTVVYRAGDQIGAWAYLPMAAAGLGITGISIVAVVLGLVSIANAIWLGQRHQSAASAVGDRPAASDGHSRV